MSSSWRFSSSRAIARAVSATIFSSVFFCARARQQLRLLRVLLRREFALAFLRMNEVAAGEAEHQRIVVLDVAENVEQVALVGLDFGLLAPDFVEPRLLDPLQLLLHQQQTLERAVSFTHQFPLTVQSAKSAMKAVTIEFEMK